MPDYDPASPALAVAAAALAGFLSGVVPSGMAEVGALGLGLVRPPALALAMLAAFTLGHVAAKVPWFLAGALADRLPPGRVADRVARARGFLAERPSYGMGLLALSALTSVPPFHLASIAAGVVRLPFARFLLTCVMGRAVRFAVLAAVPSLARAWLP